MVDIIITNTMSKIQGYLDKELVSDLDIELSYDISGAQFSEKVQRGIWDGRKHLFSTTTYSFPTGLLERVCSFLNDRGVAHIINDQRIVATVPQGQSIISKMKPWDWQQNIITSCYTKKRGIIKAPTGSGKGVMLVYLTGLLNIPGTVILVNKRDILYQIMKDVKKNLGIDVGIVGDGKVDIKPITIAMVQTVARTFKIRAEGLDERDKTKLNSKQQVAIRNLMLQSKCLIADEVHNMVAKTYYGIQKQCKNVYYKYGFSATPYRTDKADLLLEAAFGPRIADIPCSELIDRGYLAKPTFYLVKFKHKKAPKYLEYADLYEQEVVANEDRNFLITKLVKKFWDKGKKILIVVQQRKHGKLLEEMCKFVLGEENVRYVHGDSDTELRQDTLADLDKGNIRLVIATRIYSEGVNVPGLDVLMNVKAQVSPVDFIQTVGRAMRKTPTKDKVTVVDIYDYGCRYLERHSKERMGILQKEPAFVLNMIDAGKI